MSLCSRDEFGSERDARVGINAIGPLADNSESHRACRRHTARGKSSKDGKRSPAVRFYGCPETHDDGCLDEKSRRVNLSNLAFRSAIFNPGRRNDLVQQSMRPGRLGFLSFLPSPERFFFSGQSPRPHSSVLLPVRNRQEQSLGLITSVERCWRVLRTVNVPSSADLGFRQPFFE